VFGAHTHAHPYPISLKATSLYSSLHSARAGAQQQFAAELETPYIEVAFELQAGEDAEHKIRTFCGLEEIPSTTAHSLMSALHTLLQDDVRSLVVVVLSEIFMDFPLDLQTSLTMLAHLSVLLHCGIHPCEVNSCPSFGMRVYSFVSLFPPIACAACERMFAHLGAALDHLAHFASRTSHRVESILLRLRFLVGLVRPVDRRRHRIWYAGQMGQQ
jgi:hypothetical protein